MKKVIAQLKVFEIQCKNNYSLYYGKTGLIIAYYLVAAVLDEKKYLVKAKELIDELGANIDSIQNFNFENGLAGVGWGIEWLVQNKLMDANSDEVLEDMDDELYKTVVYSKSNSLSFTDGTIGKAMYFYKRLSACNPNTSRYRNICNQECLILLIDELNDILLDEKKEITYDEIVNNPAKVKELAEALLFLARINHTKIDTEISKRIICAISKFTGQYFFSDKFENDKYKECDLYLIYACYKAGQYLNDDSFLLLARETYHLYIHNFDENSAYSLFSSFILHRLSELIVAPVPIKNLRIRTEELNIFSILNSINALTASSKYKWEEGWGL